MKNLLMVSLLTLVTISINLFSNQTAQRTDGPIQTASVGDTEATEEPSLEDTLKAAAIAKFAALINSSDNNKLKEAHKSLMGQNFEEQTEKEDGERKARYQIVMLDSISSRHGQDGRALLFKEYSTSAANMALVAQIVIEIDYLVKFDREFNPTIDVIKLNLASLKKYSNYEGM